MRIRIGATSYVFRYYFDSRGARPNFAALLRMAKNAGLDSLQICENASPLELPLSEWPDLRAAVERLGLQVTLGCMTLDPDVVDAYLDRVAALTGSQLRIVLERGGGAHLDVPRIRGFMDSVLPKLECRSMRLAIENHFEIPSRVLAEAVAPYPTETVGFCVDIANSLRNFEDAETVLDLLGDRAFCYHLKDYRVSGTNVGFTVSGAPFGDGQAPTHAILQRIFQKTSNPEIYLETWTPSTGDPQEDIRTDAAWLDRSIARLRVELSGFER